MDGAFTLRCSKVLSFVEQYTKKKSLRRVKCCSTDLPKGNADEVTLTSGTASALISSNTNKKKKGGTWRCAFFSGSAGTSKETLCCTMHNTRLEVKETQLKTFTGIFNGRRRRRRNYISNRLMEFISLLGFWTRNNFVCVPCDGCGSQLTLRFQWVVSPQWYPRESGAKHAHCGNFTSKLGAAWRYNCNHPHLLLFRVVEQTAEERI